MATRPATKPKPRPMRRRTQAERRAATRAALLDATIDCLVEYGYAGTTTTKVVERAGVSRGAQVHHFQTKASLVADAVRHLADRRFEQMQAEAARLPEGRPRVEAALDLLWKSHSGPLFQAALELWVAARTDEELRASLVPVERELIRETLEACRELFGSYAESPSFTANVHTALSAIEGLAFAGAVLSADGRQQRISWRACRERLVTLFETDGAPRRQGGAR